VYQRSGTNAWPWGKVGPAFPALTPNAMAARNVPTEPCNSYNTCKSSNGSLRWIQSSILLMPSEAPMRIPVLLSLALGASLAPPAQLSERGASAEPGAIGVESQITRNVLFAAFTPAAASAQSAIPDCFICEFLRGNAYCEASHNSNPDDMKDCDDSNPIYCQFNRDCAYFSVVSLARLS
jgi:hypothetical protein